VDVLRSVIGTSLFFELSSFVLGLLLFGAVLGASALGLHVGRRLAA
jgi:hypothetical protein